MLIHRLFGGIQTFQHPGLPYAFQGVSGVGATSFMIKSFSLVRSAFVLMFHTLSLGIRLNIMLYSYVTFLKHRTIDIFSQIILCCRWMSYPLQNVQHHP